MQWNPIQWRTDFMDCATLAMLPGPEIEPSTGRMREIDRPTGDAFG
jgi:hypothetical protein